MKPENAVRLHVEPISKRMTDLFIDQIHRHHGPTPPGLNLFCIAAIQTGTGVVCGVATGAIPSAANRLTDGARTMEVVRVATDGTPNACSLLYGAAARAAKALGYTRIITYTLPTEPGASLRGAGWDKDPGDYGDQPWDNRPGRRNLNVGVKQRWSLTFHASDRPSQIVDVEETEDNQAPLFEMTSQP